MLIYMAGPIFTPYERSFIAANAAQLRALGFECFVPHEQGPLPGSQRRPMLGEGDQGPAPQPAAVGIFDQDNQGLWRANAVVALLDGPMVDDGTACEVGMFYGLMQHDRSKVGIVGVLTDSRTSAAFEGRGLNLYLLGCLQRAGGVFPSMDQALPTLLSWRAQLEPAEGRGAESAERGWD